MEDGERKRREDIHLRLLDMEMDPELSDEAALKIGVGSFAIAVDFCVLAATRERVRKEAQKVPHKTGLRSQGPTSLRGLSAPPPDLLGNAAMGPSSSMALVVASNDAEPNDDATEETAQPRACVTRAEAQLHPFVSPDVPVAGAPPSVEDMQKAYKLNKPLTAAKKMAPPTPRASRLRSRRCFAPR